MRYLIWIIVLLFLWASFVGCSQEHKNCMEKCKCKTSIGACCCDGTCKLQCECTNCDCDLIKK